MRMLTEREFPAFITSRPVVVLHIDTCWDTYRDTVRAKMLEAQAALKEFAAFAEVDADTEADLCRSLGVANVPHVAYFRDGKMVAVLVGTSKDIRAETEHILNGKD
jgi:thioredoxin-like negative regulator of GroEL